MGLHMTLLGIQAVTSDLPFIPCLVLRDPALSSPTVLVWVLRISARTQEDVP